MKTIRSVVLLASVVWMLDRCAWAVTTFTLTDRNTGAPRVFTNSMGMAVLEGGLIVFEGVLESALAVPKASDPSSGAELASVEVAVQVQLYDELPLASEVGAVQGAIVALSDAPAATTGKYFAWGITNNAPVAWVPLRGTNGVQFTAIAGHTNYFSLVFNYPIGGGQVSYTVFVGTSGVPVNEPSLPIASPSQETFGIHAISLSGRGALRSIFTASGVARPLSSSIDFIAYASGDGVMVEIQTANESGDGPISIFAWINGAWVLLGTINVGEVTGSGSHRYRLLVSGLEAGQSYLFKVEDEAGFTHYSDQAIPVQLLRLEEVRLTLATMEVVFNSEQGRRYQVLISDQLGGADAQWAPALVRHETARGMSELVDTPFTAGPGGQTRVWIPKNRNQAFFRVVMVE